LRLWTGEGLGVAWPGGDLAIVAFAAMFLAVKQPGHRARTPPQGGGLVVTVLTNALRELAGLFIDDGALALG